VIRAGVAALAWLAAAVQGEAQELDRILSSVVGLRSEVPEDARTAESLGIRRSGSGVVIDAQGLVLVRD